MNNHFCIVSIARTAFQVVDVGISFVCVIVIACYEPHRARIPSAICLQQGCSNEESCSVKWDSAGFTASASSRVCALDVKTEKVDMGPLEVSSSLALFLREFIADIQTTTEIPPTIYFLPINGNIHCCNAHILRRHAYIPSTT
jgi:hypothetical protein